MAEGALLAFDVADVVDLRRRDALVEKRLESRPLWVPVLQRVAADSEELLHDVLYFVALNDPAFSKVVGNTREMLAHQPVHRLLVFLGRDAFGVERHVQIRVFATPLVSHTTARFRLPTLCARDAELRNVLAVHVADAMSTLVLRQGTKNPVIDKPFARACPHICADADWA